MYTDYYSYDIETYLNCFTCRFKRDSDGAEWKFEISEWKDEGFDLFIFISQVNSCGAAMVGYNNVKFDYPVIHLLMEHKGAINYRRLYQKGQVIIQDGNRGLQWNHVIWDRDRYCPQIDLMMIHHFDNKAKLTSLKLLEFNMRMDDIQELPYSPHVALSRSQADEIMSYNGHDVEATHQFLQHTKSMLGPRYELSKQYGIDFTNFNDTKMGERITIEILKKNGVFLKKGDKTVRTQINVGEILFDYIEFTRPEFQEIHNFFKNAVIEPENIKGFFGALNCTVNGFQYDFGAGGIHGSRHNTIVRTGGGRKLRDSDVASYYPNIGIKNKIAPEHIGEAWCDAMDWMYHERLRVGKKTTEGNGYKLALNGSYGKSNDEHSVLCDPQYTMSITINGQLLLCMLAEALTETVPEFEMVQINTDGLTYTFPDEHESLVDEICEWWEALTKLELEHVDYRMMAIRDVNNYLAVTMPEVKEGKIKPGYVKRIGAYAYTRAEESAATRELPWNKNHGGIVVAKAAEAALVRNENIEMFIRNHAKVAPLDFMFRAKVPRSAKLVGVRDRGWGMKSEVTLSNITRYYVSTSGVELVKIMEPTQSQMLKWQTTPHWVHKVSGEHKCAKKAPSGMWKETSRPTEIPADRRIGIEAGRKVTECNKMTEEALSLIDVDIKHYVAETRKLVDKLLTKE
ncbi:coil containing protein [Vibrio phage 393E50-1]|nr:coil containing protein [Vibrio phage 393E50-1]